MLSGLGHLLAEGNVLKFRGAHPSRKSVHASLHKTQQIVLVDQLGPKRGLDVEGRLYKDYIQHGVKPGNPHHFV